MEIPSISLSIYIYIYMPKVTSCLFWDYVSLSPTHPRQQLSSRRRCKTTTTPLGNMTLIRLAQKRKRHLTDFTWEKTPVLHSSFSLAQTVALYVPLLPRNVWVRGLISWERQSRNIPMLLPPRDGGVFNAKGSTWSQCVPAASTIDWKQAPGQSCSLFQCT